MPATRITWQDVLTMPEDGNRYEAIGGELVMSPPPMVRHQWVTERLLGAMRDLLVRSDLGFLFPAPIGVVFPDTDEGVQPDIVFVRTARLNIIREDAICGPPDLVIEILSPRRSVATAPSSDTSTGDRVCRNTGSSISMPDR